MLSIAWKMAPEQYEKALLEYLCLILSGGLVLNMSIMERRLVQAAETIVLFLLLVTVSLPSQAHLTFSPWQGTF